MRKVGFLTRRKYTGIKTLHRFILSYLIYKIQGILVHTYIVFLKDGIEYVREMEYNGVRIITYEEYKKLYGDRIIYEINLPNNKYIEIFDNYCYTNKVNYDFISLFITFPIKFLFHLTISKNTNYQRSCSEDSSRCINILLYKIIKDPENTSPVKLYKILIENDTNTQQ